MPKVHKHDDIMNFEVIKVRRQDDMMNLKCSKCVGMMLKVFKLSKV